MSPFFVSIYRLMRVCSTAASEIMVQLIPVLSSNFGTAVMAIVEFSCYLLSEFLRDYLNCYASSGRNLRRTIQIDFYSAQKTMLTSKFLAFYM